MANRSAPHTLIVCAYDVREHGSKVTPLDEEKVRAGPFVGQDGYRWIHLHLDEDDPFPELPDMLGVSSLISEALHAAETRPRLTLLNGEFLLNLRGVNLNPGADPEDMVSIRLWVSDHLMVSVRRRRLIAIDTLRAAIDAGRAPATPGRLIADLAFGLTLRMEEVINDLSDAVDELEDESLNDTSGLLRAQLADLRRKAIVLRRYIAPQREAMNRLAIENVPLIGEQERMLLRETSDRVLRFVEELDSVRERANVLHDQLADTRAEIMNRNMLVLSIVAAIFLPLSLLTGLLGINVAGIPGAEDPQAFAIVVSSIAAIGLLEYLIFRYWKWI